MSRLIKRKENKIMCPLFSLLKALRPSADTLVFFFLLMAGTDSQNFSFKREPTSSFFFMLALISLERKWESCPAAISRDFGGLPGFPFPFSFEREEADVDWNPVAQERSPSVSSNPSLLFHNKEKEGKSRS